MPPKIPIVSVFIPRRGGRLWSYLAASELPPPGSLVAVPFGRQKLLGVVASDRTESPQTPETTLKAISQVYTANVLPDELWSLVKWIERYYMVPRGRVLEHLVSLNVWALEGTSLTLRGRKEFWYRVRTGADPVLKHAKAKQAWHLVSGLSAFSKSNLSSIYADPNKPIRSWLDQNWIEQTKAPAVVKNFSTNQVSLNVEQTQIATNICASLGDKGSVHLLFGITGSGKTEVYAHVIENVLAAKKTVLVLAPEIALVPPLQSRLENRLGISVGTWHSAMAVGERAEILRGISDGSLRVVVGARSALFAPLKDIGLIVVDEEHDGGFLLSDGINVNIRDAAIQRAKLSGAAIVLGSATPSLEIYYRAQSISDIQLHRLNARAKSVSLPLVDIVDVRSPSERSGATWMSKTLQSEISACLIRREQVVLFRNRRGFHPVLVCNGCGSSVDCPNCAATLTVHSRPVTLRCHICGHSQEPLAACPSCGGLKLAAVGTGTQRISEELASMFPSAKIERLDRDKVTSAMRVSAVLDQFQRGDIDILVGTQMVTKGLDIDNVTLVGVINVDGSLHQPDFRAAERTFQHLSQVTGRAGRGAKPGRVIIQTHHPDHPVIAAAAAQNFSSFASREIAQRQLTGYPPFSRLVRIVWEDSRNEHLTRVSENAVLRTARQGVTILGPAPCPLERSKGRWRWHVIGKSNDVRALRAWAMTLRNFSQDISCEIEIDPQNML